MSKMKNILNVAINILNGDHREELLIDVYANNVHKGVFNVPLSFEICNGVKNAHCCVYKTYFRSDNNSNIIVKLKTPLSVYEKAEILIN